MIQFMPHFPIPPLLRGTDAGSFAEDTLVRRLPQIALRVLSENRFDEATKKHLTTLASDLPRGLIRPLLDKKAPDWFDWQTALQPFLGQSWLEVPLFAAEIYFYRRILEATGYFQPGPGFGVDPYRLQKELGLAQAGSTIAQALPPDLRAGKDQLHHLIYMSLWGNQADLSLWPVQGKSGGRAQGGGGETHLLVDQSAAALAQIEGLDGGRLELILDNSGTELILDLLLADALLARNPRFSIRLQVKPHPVFVSDALAPDVKQALLWLKTSASTWAHLAALRLEQAERAGRMQVTTHFYWASPSPAWEMPPDLWADLAGSILMITKGDVNYRRWLGDAHWPAATSLDAIVNPPAPLLLLRVSKSDVVAGLNPGQADVLRVRDPSWQVNGYWGMIQFVKPHKQK
jgi:Damage-control phosphatase ARMT1-like domain